MWWMNWDAVNNFVKIKSRIASKPCIYEGKMFDLNLLVLIIDTQIHILAEKVVTLKNCCFLYVTWMNYAQTIKCTIVFIVSCLDVTVWAVEVIEDEQLPVFDLYVCVYNKEQFLDFMYTN